MRDSLVLYDYWRSSAAYRVRIALNIKALRYEQQPVHLVRDGGQQRQPAYASLNPQRLVPTLLHGEAVLTQSLAIVEYLEERWPEPRLLPQDPLERARVRSLAQVIACDLHPLNNLRVLAYLRDRLRIDDTARTEWYRHWVADGLTAFESLLARAGGKSRFCHGDSPGLADCCLMPQVYNARRFDCDMQAFPLIRQVAANCETIDAFKQAHPDNQPDAE